MAVTGLAIRWSGSGTPSRRPSRCCGRRDRVLGPGWAGTAAGGRVRNAALAPAPPPAPQSRPTRPPAARPAGGAHSRRGPPGCEALRSGRPRAPGRPSRWRSAFACALTSLRCAPPFSKLVFAGLGVIRSRQVIVGVLFAVKGRFRGMGSAWLESPELRASDSDALLRRVRPRTPARLSGAHAAPAPASEAKHGAGFAGHCSVAISS